MLQYVAAHTCRRARLARHFAEPPPPCHAMCDMCTRGAGAAPGAPAAAAGCAAAAAAGPAAAAAAAAAGAGGGGGVELKDVTEAAKGAVQTLQVGPGPRARGQRDGSRAARAAWRKAACCHPSHPADAAIHASTLLRLSPCQAWPGSEKRATLLQLVDKWRASKVGAGQGGARAACLSLCRMPDCCHRGRRRCALPVGPRCTAAAPCLLGQGGGQGAEPPPRTHPPCHPPRPPHHHPPTQDKSAAKAAKALSRDECEAALQALLVQDALRVDLGFTAYATNAYLKAGPRAASLLAVRAACRWGRAGGRLAGGGWAAVCVSCTLRSIGHFVSLHSFGPASAPP